MSTLLHRTLPAALAFLLATCAFAAMPEVIPLPAKMQALPHGFSLDGDTRIVVDEAARPSGEMLAARLRQGTGLALPVVVAPLSDARNAIVLTTSGADSGSGAEGYALTAGPDSVIIRAADAAGLFYGAQTLLQLLPPDVFAPAPVAGGRWTVPGVMIEDGPRFRWRGVLLDVGRRMFSVDEIKRLLDSMALHKLNVFHWHLTEDAGWRIEIKKYPRLTEVGAWRESSPNSEDSRSSDGRRYGGFYTQEQIKEVVAYAAARHITVVPEIEMPGHSSAAIAAYPQFGNDDIPDYAPKVATHWIVHPYIYSPKEETFRFLEDVLTEVCELFPSRFIHIGGDEAPKKQWKESPFAQSVIKREGLKDEHELQSWFIRRIGKFLESKGRRLVGWDEIQEGGLPASATMMVWRDEKWARHALELGNDVVMAPLWKTYFNLYQVPRAFELAKGEKFRAMVGVVPISQVYAWDPAAVAADAAQAARILGTQGNLWGEFLGEYTMLEYIAYPRLAALAEVAWSPQAARHYDDFNRRLAVHFTRFDRLGINYYKDAVVELGSWHGGTSTAAAPALEWDVTAHVAAGTHRVVLTRQGRTTGSLRVSRLVLLENGQEAASVAGGQTINQQDRDAEFKLEIPLPRPGARYLLRVEGEITEGSDLKGLAYWQLIAPSSVP